MTRRGRGIGPSADAIAQYERERPQALRATRAGGGGAVCGDPMPRELAHYYGEGFVCAREPGHLEGDAGPSGAAHWHHGPDGRGVWGPDPINTDDVIATMPPRRRGRA